MSRRSRSQRPPKARSTETPVLEVPAGAKINDERDELSREPSAALPADELAALDAGWDDLLR
jgi:hypothetical protein